jgi:predicted RNase H-like nuclease
MRATRDDATIIETGETQGDADLFEWLKARIPRDDCSLLSIDAPLIVPNGTGSRPVDRDISREFGKYHVACHSANATKCLRPLRIARALRESGYIIDHDLKLARRIATEVYPHPAMVRLFALDRIIKYKKGSVESKKIEFKTLQSHVRTALSTVFSEVTMSYEIEELLNKVWSKPVEDKTDALFCAMIAYLHWKHDGHLSRIVGSVESGFILLPPKSRNGFFLWEESEEPIVTSEMVKKLMNED